MYDEKDLGFLDFIIPLIDLRSLAVRIKEKGSQGAVLEGLQLISTAKKIAKNIADVPDSELRIQLREFLRRLECVIASLKQKTSAVLN